MQYGAHLAAWLLTTMPAWCKRLHGAPSKTAHFICSRFLPVLSSLRARLIHSRDFVERVWRGCAICLRANAWSTAMRSFMHYATPHDFPRWDTCSSSAGWCEVRVLDGFAARIGLTAGPAQLVSGLLAGSLVYTIGPGCTLYADATHGGQAPGAPNFCGNATS